MRNNSSNRKITWRQGGLGCLAIRFNLVPMLQKKKRFSVSTLLKPRLRCGRRHFFATRVDLKKEAADFASRLYQSPPGGNLQKKTDGFLVTKTWPTTGAFSGRPSLAGKIAIFAPQDQQLQHQKFCQKHPRRGPGSTVCSLLPGSQGSFSKTFKDTVCFSSLAFCLDFISLLASKTLPLAQQWAPIRLLEMTRSICFGFMEDPWPGFSLLGSQTS